MVKFLKEGINYKRRKDLEIFQEKILETTYVEIKTRSDTDIIVGSLYKPPNTNERALCDHIDEITSKINAESRKKEVIMGMDHNLDLLKSSIHQPTQRFLDKMLECGMLPSIMRPTRIT